eukprot:3929090-Pyramimonas_sp.AAC.1
MHSLILTSSVLPPRPLHYLPNDPHLHALLLWPSRSDLVLLLFATGDQAMSDVFSADSWFDADAILDRSPMTAPNPSDFRVADRMVLTSGRRGGESKSEKDMEGR